MVVSNVNTEIESIKSYEELKEKIASISVNRDVCPVYSKFIMAQLWFELNLGDKWEAFFVDAIKETLINALKAEAKNDLNDINSDDLEELFNINQLLKDCVRDEENINEYWSQEDGQPFISLLRNFRDKENPTGELSEQLLEFAQHINNDPLRYVYEILQNADDATNKEGKNKAEFSIDLSEDGKMIVTYDERGMNYLDIISLTTVGKSNKKNRKDRRLIGEKGIGFKTIFSVCEKVEIHSGGYHFALQGVKKDKEEEKKGKGNIFKPSAIPPNKELDRSSTQLILFLKEEFLVKLNEEKEENTKPKDIYTQLKVKYGFNAETDQLEKERIFKNCPVLFTNRIKSMTIKSLEETFTIQCNDTEIKQKTTGPTGSPVECSGTEITYKITASDGTPIEEEKIEIVTIKKDVEFTFEEYASRYPDQFEQSEYENEQQKSNNEDESPIKYPIFIVAPKDVTNIKEGNLYSYLPTYTNIKAPFNIQLPLKLNLDRSCMWFKNDQDTSNEKVEPHRLTVQGEEKTLLWNHRLLEEMKGLFVLLYERIKEENNSDIFDYIPNLKEVGNNNEIFFNLFKSEKDYAASIEKLNSYLRNKLDSKSLFEVFESIEYFKQINSKEYCTSKQAIMFDGFIHTNFYEDYFNEVKGCLGDDKNLVVYNEKALKKTEHFGFKLYSGVKEEEKANYLNAVLKGKEDALIVECLKIKGRSKYLPKKIDDLKIIPAASTNGKIRYETKKSNFWFESSEQYYSDGKLCFFAGDFENTGLFEDLTLIKAEKPKIWKEINRDEDIDKALFMEFMQLVYPGKEEQWFEDLRRILKERKEEEFLTGATDYKKLLNILDDNREDWCKNEEQEDLRFHSLCILAHVQKPSKKLYILPLIKCWTEYFIDSLNSLIFDQDFNIRLNEQESLYSIEDESLIKQFEIFEIAKEKISVCEYLLEEFARFNQQVILKAEEQEIVTKCLNSLEEGLSVYVTFEPKRERILNDVEAINDYREKESRLTDITNICGIQAHFTGDNKRSIIGQDNQILNELLQNANDRIKDGKLDIIITDTEFQLIYKESGFSVKDFLAISLSGNSGNRDYSGHNNHSETATGHKGTGFKSIYNVFEKVIIASGPVKCVLDDTKEIKCKFPTDKTVEVSWQQSEKKANEKRYFPVPEFSENSDSKDGETKIILTFKGDKAQQFKSNAHLSSVQEFINSGVYYFLKNISEFTINGELFDKKKYMAEHFYYEEKKVIDVAPFLSLNPRLKEQEDLATAKKEITFLFPKGEKKVSSDMPNIYCDLPIGSSKEGLQFFINIPALELEDGRNKISENDNVKKWNEHILGLAYKRENSAFQYAFEKFAQAVNRNEIDGCSVERILDFFPFNKLPEWEGLEQIPFIASRSNGNNEISLISIDEMKTNKLLLEQYLNVWIEHKFDYLSDFPISKFVCYKKADLARQLRGHSRYFENSNESDYEALRQYFSNIYYTTNLIRNGASDFEIQFLKGHLYSKYPEESYKWFLGETICKSAVYSIHNNLGEIEGFIKTSVYEEQVRTFFRRISSDLFDESFVNLRDELYFKKGSLVTTDDPFLNAFVELKKADIYSFGTELNKLSGESKTEVRELVEKKLVAIKYGDGKVGFLEGSISYLYKSDIIEAPYILNGPEWVKDNLVELLDEKVKDAAFYQVNSNRTNSKRDDIVKKYLEKGKLKVEIASAIKKYFEETQQLEADVELFKICCDDLDMELVWEEKYSPFISVYSEYLTVKEAQLQFNSKVKFKFLGKSIVTPLSKDSKQKFSDQVDSKKQNEKFEFTMFSKKEQSLNDIVNDIQVCTTKDKKGYCINFEEENIVIFGEQSSSFKLLLKNLFDCKNYGIPIELTPIDCHLPMQLLKNKFDTWETITPIELEEDMDDKSLKRLLINRHEKRVAGKWLCYEGYGAASKQCPICKGELLAEASSLKIRSIRAISGEENISVPILLCGNCNEATKYATNVYLTLKSADESIGAIIKDKQLLEEQLLSTEPIQICFDMYTREMKVYDIHMPYLHRAIILQLLQE